ncbi:MAG: hypothetical protein L6R35_006602 [Caloplaca aegaea]|nr:MAG: hypothetical protein L6R35_006602 [Caloplaca aegaea]
MHLLPFLSLTLLLNHVSALPPIDPSGAKNVGLATSTQFIGGQCHSNADCASGCCANPIGICSGPGAARQNGKEGCGFTSSSADPASAATALTENKVAAGGGGDGAVVAGAEEIEKAAPVEGGEAGNGANGGPAFDPAGEKNVGNGQGGQFIGGQCLSGEDCASGCCAGPGGICSGSGAQLQKGKTGCGFGG